MTPLVFLCDLAFTQFIMLSLPSIPLTSQEIVHFILIPGLWSTLLLAGAWQAWDRRARWSGNWAWAFAIPLVAWLMARDINGRVPALTKFGGTAWLYWVACGLVALSLADALLRFATWQRLMIAALAAAAACWGIAWNFLHGPAGWTPGEAALRLGLPIVLTVVHAVSIDRLSARQPGWVVPFLYLAGVGAGALVLGTSGASKVLANFSTVLASVLGGAWLAGIVVPRLSLARGGAIAVATLSTLLLTCGWWLGPTPSMEHGRFAPYILPLQLALVSAGPLAAWLATLLPGVGRYQRVNALAMVVLTLATLVWPIYQGLIYLQELAADGY